MNLVVLCNLLAALALITAEFRLFFRRKQLKLTQWVLAPLEISIFLYFLIALSNVLEHGGITGFFDPFEDIAEIIFTFTFLFFINNWRSQKSMETIRNKESWLNSAFEYLPEGIITTDGDGKIQFLNREMEDMTGWSRAEARGRDAGDILVFADKESGKPVNYNPFRALLSESPANRFPRGIFIRNRNGEMTLVMNSVSLIRNPEGRVLGAVGAFRDIGEFDSLMEQLTHTHKMEAIGQLAGGVAHDLNNMLGGILGAADLLKLEFSEDGITGYDKMIDIIINSTINGRELTSNLLAFSRKGKILSTPISMNDIIVKTAAIAERTIGKQYALTTEIPIEPLLIVGDPSQIQNSLLNLILNARDAQPRGGLITVSADGVMKQDGWCNDCEERLTGGDYVRLRVKDQGEGIPPEIQKKIFEPFFTTKPEGKGTGLGLAAVYGTVISHKGTIHLDSRIGEGTCFSLYFPRVKSSDTGKSREDGYVPSGHSGKTVLVIEDEAILRSTIAMMLDQCGMRCLPAENGERGIKLFREKQGSIDAVFLDMVMPGMSGADVLVHLKQIQPDIPVIMTSGFSSTGSLTVRPDGFLKKPFRMNELLEILNRCLNREKEIQD